MKGKKAICELLGSYFFILTISMAASTDASNFAPLAIGFMLMAMVFTFGYISGGHFNPAVTIGVVLIHQLKKRRAFFYILCQLIGGLLAGLTGWVLLEKPENLHPPRPTADSGMPVFRAFFAEAIYTCCLVSVVLHVACSRQRDNHHYGLAIGMTVLASAYSVGKISGGSFNPAVATSLHIQKCVSDRCGDIKFLPLYWLGPLIGAGVASFLFEVVHKTLQVEDSSIYHREDASGKALSGFFQPAESERNLVEAVNHGDGVA
jgi:glycerol uptake facilitator-like aquaporin